MPRLPDKAVLLLTAAICGGCANVIGDDNYVIPDEVLNISKSATWQLEGVVAAGLLYIVIDPLAPNWRIEESRIDHDRYRIAMRKKRFTTGGDGEAAQVFYRRAGELVREAGASGYRVIEFSEGVESNVPIAQRVAYGVVEVIR